MALDQSALLALTESLRTADGGDVMRTLLTTILQALIEAETTARIGADRYQRTDERTTSRNGTRTKTVTTTSGDLDVKIAKLRSGSFFPSLLEPRRRVDRALHAVIMEAYVHGVSTRKVDDLVTALGSDTGISKSEVSRICADLDEEVTAFNTRELGGQEFPYVFLDATYCKARAGGRRGGRGAAVVSQAVVIATGVAADGRREVLGCAVGDSETEAFWAEFLRSLRARGLHGFSWSSPTTTAVYGLRSTPCCSGWRGRGVGCTSCATFSPVSPRGRRRWSPPPSAPSSANPPGKMCGNRWTPSRPCSNPSFPRWQRC